jgi:hypothetical protein
LRLNKLTAINNGAKQRTTGHCKEEWPSDEEMEGTKWPQLNGGLRDFNSAAIQILCVNLFVF